MTTRITAGMVQRCVLADLNTHQRQARRRRRPSRVGQGDHQAQRRPVRRRAARWRCARSSRRTRSTSATSQDARGWQDTTETALSSMTDAIQRARDLVTQGSTDSADQSSRDAIASEIEQLLAGIKQDANTTYNGAYVFGGTATDSAPYADADDAYQAIAPAPSPRWPATRPRDRAPDRPGRVGEHQRRRLGHPRQRLGDGKLLACCATRSRT